MKKVLLIVLLVFPILAFAKEEVKFSKCVDGDTFKAILEDEITIRLLAVDTPEIGVNGKENEYYALDASDYTCKILKNAKKIEIEYDEKSSKLDKYDRTLAWVYVDDYLLNDALVRNGYAKVKYVYDDYKYVDILNEHQSLAQKEKLGIWNDNHDEDIALWTSIFIAILLSLLAILKNKLNNIKK